MRHSLDGSGNELTLIGANDVDRGGTEGGTGAAGGGLAGLVGRGCDGGVGSWVAGRVGRASLEGLS